MSALAEREVVIIGSGSAREDYRDALEAFPELTLRDYSESVPPPGSAASAVPRPHAFWSGCSSPPNLALLCTPAEDHLEWARCLLPAGVDVLFQPPLAETRLHAESITTLAERLGRVVMTAGVFRAFAAVQEAARLIARGRLGKLREVEISLTRKRTVAAPFRAGSARRRSGVWLQNGPDAIDLIETLAGPIERIRVRELRSRQHPRSGAAAEDELRAEMIHTGGVTSRVVLGWNEQGTAPIARCRGDAGELRIGWAQSTLQTAEGSRTFAGGFDSRAARSAVLRRFLAECRRADPGEDHGGQALAWIEAGWRSHRSGSWESA